MTIDRGKQEQGAGSRVTPKEAAALSREASGAIDAVSGVLTDLMAREQQKVTRAVDAAGAPICDTHDREEQAVHLWHKRPDGGFMPELVEKVTRAELDALGAPICDTQNHEEQGKMLGYLFLVCFIVLALAFWGKSLWRVCMAWVGWL